MSKKSKVRGKVDQDEDMQEDHHSNGINTVSSESDDSEGGVPFDSPKKRKREANEENIEIDLSLPEPPNKKALRKAKKSKKVSKADGTEEQAGHEEHVGVKVEAEDTNGTAPQVLTDHESNASRPKSTYSIWIGNLPFSATKAMITDFLTNNSEPKIHKQAITRVHVPAPANAKATKTTIKPLNKGFAYVDFADQQSFAAALALSEQQLASRSLLIKDAKSFEGRPKEHQTKQESGLNKTVSKRVFLGNLGFDVTREDLENLFQKCGAIEHVHLATFEDSGKCKGYAWVTFKGEKAAEAAVKGVIIEEIKEKESRGKEPGKDRDAKAEPKPKKRQWWCNRLNGREIRREFAEDPTVRYQKRFGKTRQGSDGDEEGHGATKMTEEQSAWQYVKARQPRLDPGGPTDPKKRRGRTFIPDFQGQGQSITTAETLGDTAERTQYRTGQVAQSRGKKVTFD